MEILYHSTAAGSWPSHQKEKTRRQKFLYIKASGMTFFSTFLYKYKIPHTLRNYNNNSYYCFGRLLLLNPLYSEK